MTKHRVPIEKAAEELGLRLIRDFPEVVGVSVRRVRSGPSNEGGLLILSVEIDDKAAEVPDDIPGEFEGHHVQVRRVTVPRIMVPSIE